MNNQFFEDLSINSLNLLQRYYTDPNWDVVNTHEKDVLLRTKTVVGNPVIIKRSEGLINCSCKKLF